MKTIGLVGGVASGKSRVARLLVDCGAGLLDADRTGHAVLAEDPEVRQRLLERLGPGILAADGSVDRRQVGRRVFGDGELSSTTVAQDREFLEGILHPRIADRLRQQQEDFAREGRPAVVLDAPLLLEAGWQPLCDLLIMVEAPRETRLERAAGRGWTEAEFARREAAQWPVEKKRHQADAVIDNSKGLEELAHQVRALWARIVPGSPAC